MRLHTSQKPSVMIAIAVACNNFMLGIDQTIVATSLPAIARDLGQTPAPASVILTGYMAALLIALPSGSWVINRFGARRSYIAAILMLIASSVISGLAGTFWQLMFGRVLQGAASALLATIGQAVLLASYDRDKTLKVRNYTSLAGQVAPLAGPIIGGLMSTYLSWRGIFFVNLPIGVVALILAWRVFPSAVRGDSGRFDFLGFLLVGLGAALLVLGMNSLAADSSRVLTSLGLFAMSLLSLALAILHSLRRYDPILDFGLLRIRTFRISMVTGGGIDVIGLTAVMFLVPIMLQVVFGLSAAKAGFITSAAAVGAVAARFFLPVLLKRNGFRRLLLMNTPLLALTVAVFALVQPTSSEWIVAGLVMVFGVLKSIQQGTAANLAYVDIPYEKMPQFATLYWVLWHVSLTISVGIASIMIADAPGPAQHLTGEDFRIAFAVEVVIILCALPGYLGLRHADGAVVSGHVKG